MDPEDLTDEDLLEALHDAQREIAGESESTDRHEAWQRVIALMRELERRYPPSTEPLDA